MLPAADFTPARVLETLRAAPVEPASLAPYLDFNPQRYTRSRVYQHARFEMLLLCWEPGQRSAVHNHAGQECWMLVPVGCLVNQNYRVLETDVAQGDLPPGARQPVPDRPRAPLSRRPGRAGPPRRERRRRARRQPARLLAALPPLPGLLAGKRPLRRSRPALHPRLRGARRSQHGRRAVKTDDLGERMRGAGGTSTGCACCPHSVIVGWMGRNASPASPSAASRSRSTRACAT